MNLNTSTKFELVLKKPEIKTKQISPKFILKNQPNFNKNMSKF